MLNPHMAQQLPSPVITTAARKSHELEERVKQKTDTVSQKLKSLFRLLSLLQSDGSEDSKKATFAEVCKISSDLRQAAASDEKNQVAKVSG